MNRTVDIEINGRSWPMCLTMAAYIQICEKYGDLPPCLARLDQLVTDKDNKGLIIEYTWLADQLLWSAHDAAGGDDEDAPPDQDHIMTWMSPGDMIYLQRKVLECINLGQSREVGVAAPKNGEGAGTDGSPVQSN